MARGGYRPGSGPKKGTKYRPRKKKEPTGEANPKENKMDRVVQDEENLMPLDLMLMIMRDPCEDMDRRVRMAIAAAPFVHTRKDESGKKKEKELKAKTAGEGKFAPGRPPLSMVK